MKKLLLPVLGLFISSFLFAQPKNTDEVIEKLTAQKDHYSQIAKQIWEFAELGYLEEKSSQLLQNEMTQAGFQVETGVAGIPTAFVASYGSGRPIIGLLAEFDALPGVSQEAIPEKKIREGNEAGHACGHHLFGTASSAAAIALKEWLKDHKVSGTVRLYGTPAEEGGAGKVYMVREGLFDDVDAVLHWHPGDGNSADAASSLANKSAKFRFHGIASHAASAPQHGRSALDGVEAMNFMVNLMREHVPADSRIHYVITKGGEAPNVVPAFAEVFYYTRNPQMREVRDIFERVVEAAEGAAKGTGTRVEYEVIHGLYNVLPNETLAQIMHKNLELVGGVEYDAKEMAFAKELATTLPEKRQRDLSDANRIKDFEIIEKGRGGSTDVGDVSWMVPTAGLRTATWVPGTSAHTWQAVAAGGMSIGMKGMMVAAKTLTLTGIDLFLQPELCTTAKTELQRRRGDDFKYQPLLGDRKPPLDYRK